MNISNCHEPAVVFFFPLGYPGPRMLVGGMEQQLVFAARLPPPLQLWACPTKTSHQLYVGTYCEVPGQLLGVPIVGCITSEYREQQEHARVKVGG